MGSAKWLMRAIIVAATFSIAHADDDDLWTPDAKTINAAQTALSQLHRPPTLPPLASFSQFYMGTVDSPHRYVAGTLLKPEWVEEFKREGGKVSSDPGLPTNVHIVSDRRNFPAFLDGSCSMEEFFTYDPVTDSITEDYCLGIRPVAPELPPLVGPISPPLAPPLIPPSISIAK